MLNKTMKYLTVNLLINKPNFNVKKKYSKIKNYCKILKS